MRGLLFPSGSRHPSGLDGRKTEGALGIRRNASKAAEAMLERFLLPVFGVRILAVRIGLPDLDQPVAHARTVAIEKPALDRNTLAADVGCGNVAREEPV